MKESGVQLQCYRNQSHLGISRYISFIELLNVSNVMGVVDLERSRRDSLESLVLNERAF